jgi:hypothetical protein
LHQDTVRRWLIRGRKESDRLDNNPTAKKLATEAIYLEFFASYKKAVAEGKIFAFGVIREAARHRPVRTEETRYSPGQWTAAAWILERRRVPGWCRDREIDVNARWRGAGLLPLTHPRVFPKA